MHSRIVEIILDLLSRKAFEVGNCGRLDTLERLKWFKMCVVKERSEYEKQGEEEDDHDYCADG